MILKKFSVFYLTSRAKPSDLAVNSGDALIILALWGPENQPIGPSYSSALPRGVLVTESALGPINSASRWAPAQISGPSDTYQEKSLGNREYFPVFGSPLIRWAHLGPPIQSVDVDLTPQGEMECRRVTR